jgi:hypothetical protein
MKIQLNKTLVGLDGKEIEGANMGKLLATILSGSNKGDAAKLWHWSVKLYAGEELDLDPSDSETLKNTIKESEQLTALSKAQMLEQFN